MESERHFEVVKRYVEIKNEEELIKCLEQRLKTSKQIGYGNNGNVFSLENEKGTFAGLCVKKVLEKPLLICNDIDTEAMYQRKLRKGGLQTPRYLIVVKDEFGQEYFIMERIKGVSIGDAIIDQKKVPKKFNVQEFCVKLEQQVNKMHSLGVLHRDLHTGNVMIDEKGNPVIIDFGTATEGHPNSESAYEESVSMYDKDKKIYESMTGQLKDDVKQIEILKSNVRKLGPKPVMYDSYGNVLGA